MRIVATRATAGSYRLDGCAPSISRCKPNCRTPTVTRNARTVTRHSPLRLLREMGHASWQVSGWRIAAFAALAAGHKEVHVAYKTGTWRDAQSGHRAKAKRTISEGVVRK